MFIKPIKVGDTYKLLKDHDDVMSNATVVYVDYSNSKTVPDSELVYGSTIRAGLAYKDPDYTVGFTKEELAEAYASGAVMHCAIKFGDPGDPDRVDIGYATITECMPELGIVVGHSLLLNEYALATSVDGVVPFSLS